MQATQTPSKTSAFRSRIAVLAMFFINGLIYFNWAVRIPDIQTQVGLTKETLGYALLGLSLGVVLALPTAGGLISRFGSRAVTVVGGLAFCLILPAISLVNTFWVLFAVLFVSGVSTSIMDIAMNAQAVAVERALGQPVMSSFHGAFSMGTFAGAGIGTLVLGRQISLMQHFLTAGIVGAVIVLLAALWLMNVDGEKQAQGAVFTLPPRALWLLGVISFCAAIGEGAMADWSTLYLEEVVDAREAVVGYGLTAFSLMMTVGRLLGDVVASRFNKVTIVRGGGTLAALGLAGAIFFPSLWTSVMGFAFVGLGLSVVIPMAYSAAGNHPSISPGQAIAGVATIGYSAFLAGPPIIGIIAERTSLQFGLGIVLVLMFVLIFNAHALNQKTT